MNRVVFILKTKELKEAMKQLKVAYRKDKLMFHIDRRLEITVTNGNVTFTLPGAIVIKKCITEGTAKATVPYLYFEDIVKSLKDIEAKFIMSEGNITVGNLTFIAETCFIKNDRILRSINLPMNHTAADVIRLLDGSYTNEEIEFNKMDIILEIAKENMRSDINEAVRILKQYGVKKADIEDVVIKSLGINSSQ